MKTFKKGDTFEYEGQWYNVTKVPSFSTVCGENVNPKSGQPSSVKVLVRDVQPVTNTPKQ